MSIGDVTPSKDKKEKYINQYTVMNYFRRTDEHLYSDLQKEILSASYRDQNEYLKTLQREYYMLHSHTPSITTTPHHRTNSRRNINIMFKHSKTSKYQGK